ncbi:hypothetical protein J4233_05970 [Candidatus Pacearchaeota archaeon]|nr:hypothetical protein [uncultured archaeon]MBS3077782.1 hypothetical protein [Candidatus Pacearchaeota archaeon]
MGEEFDPKRFAELLIILSGDVNAWKKPENRALYRGTAESSRQGDRDFDEARRNARIDARRMYDMMQGNRSNTYAFAELVNVGGELKLEDRVLVYEGLAKLAKDIADEEANRTSGS